MTNSTLSCQQNCLFWVSLNPKSGFELCVWEVKAIANNSGLFLSIFPLNSTVYLKLTGCESLPQMHKKRSQSPDFTKYFCGEATNPSRIEYPPEPRKVQRPTQLYPWSKEGPILSLRRGGRGAKLCRSGPEHVATGDSQSSIRARANVLHFVTQR